MDKKNNELRDFYLLWSTQSLSQLGSTMTGFALTLWLYEKTGSALSTAALTICTYAPYVLMSIFAGAVTDRFDKKKTMLACDTFAAVCTVLILVLYKTDLLCVWHLYAVNAVSGLMNTVQQPASEVAYTLVIPKEQYQKTSGLQSLSRSVISVGNPLVAAAVYGIAGLGAVIMLDLASFAIAFVTLACFIRIPAVRAGAESGEKLLTLVTGGLHFLKTCAGDRHFLFGDCDDSGQSACYDHEKAAGSGEGHLQNDAVFSGNREFPAGIFKKSCPLVCRTAAGLDPGACHECQSDCHHANFDPGGIVYACRNTLQFFTIPIGLALGGFLVDAVCEPFMAGQAADALPALLFGTGKGSGAAMMMFVLGAAGTCFCLVSGRKLKKYKYTEG